MTDSERERLQETEARVRRERGLPETAETTVGTFPLSPEILAGFSKIDDDAVRERREQAARRERDTRLKTIREALKRDVGARYAECTLDNFRSHGSDGERSMQTRAVGKLRSVASWSDQPNVVLYGPVGTGKDHLLIATLKLAVEAGKTVKWINGMEFFGEMRDRIGRGQPEAEFLRMLCEPDVLGISDPIPPWGDLSDFQASFLFRLIDRRYRNNKPIWITANFKATDSGTDAGDRMPSQIVDRLKHGAVVIHCNWQSYRKSV